MDNTAALADVITGLIEDPETDVTTPHGLAIKAGVPWVTLRRQVVEPGEPGPMRLEQLERIAAALGKKPSELLAAAEARQALGA